MAQRNRRDNVGVPEPGATPYRNPILRPGETLRERQRRLLQEAGEDQERLRREAEEAKRAEQTAMQLRTLPGPIIPDASEVLRYPSKAAGGGTIASNSDYVLFQFFKYNPPFGGVVGSRPDQQPDQRTNIGASAGNYFNYNQEYDPAGGKYKSIIMYMPEDISTGFRGNWGGKAFSNIATSVLQSAGAEGLNKLNNAATGVANALESFPAIAGATAVRKAIQKITGDSLSNDDVFGAISGAILNPNTELLFQSVDMRNFQLTFKLVPRNEPESVIINEIIKIFKMCTLPSRTPGEVFGMSNQGIANNFIGVPNLCRVHFMKGPDPHPVLPIYKMCAVTQVDVSYTPDGAYATYIDGQPVAIQLVLNFQETKLVFSEEISNDSIR